MRDVVNRRDFLKMMGGGALLATSFLSGLAAPSVARASVMDLSACTTFSDIIFDSRVAGTLEHCDLWGCVVRGSSVIYTGPWISWFRGVCRSLSGTLKVRYTNCCRHRDGSRGDMIVEASNVYLGENDGIRQPSASGSTEIPMFTFHWPFGISHKGYFSSDGDTNCINASCDIKVSIVRTGTNTLMPGNYFCLFGAFTEPGRQWINDVRVNVLNFDDVAWCQGFYTRSGFTGRYYLSSDTGISVAGNHFYANGSQWHTGNKIAQSVVCEVTSSLSFSSWLAWGGLSFDPYVWQQYAPDAGLKEYRLDRG